MNTDPHRQLLANRIIELVCEAFDVTPQQIRANHQHRQYSEPRQVAMYLIRIHTLMTLEEIGELFNRHHTTVMHSLGRIAVELQTVKSLNWAVNALSDQIRDMEVVTHE